MITCDIICNRIDRHLAHFYTGFSQLHKHGFVHLKQTRSSHPHAWIGIEVHVNSSVKLYYDVSDNKIVNTDILDNVHFYFKRSFL